MIQVQPTALADALLLVPAVFPDERGWFAETWSTPKYAALGLPTSWEQDSCSFSRRGVIRGIHADPSSPKLVQCLRGRVWDAIVDLRPGSPTYLRWAGHELSPENHVQVYVPAGFGHGFLALEDAIVHYKNGLAYDPSRERAVSWRNARIGIAWPLDGHPVLSPKDAAIPADALP